MKNNKITVKDRKIIIAKVKELQRKFELNSDNEKIRAQLNSFESAKQELRRRIINVSVNYVLKKLRIDQAYYSLVINGKQPEKTRKYYSMINDLGL